MTTENILVPNELCPIELMIDTISPKYVDYYIKKNLHDILYNVDDKEKLDFIILILNNFMTRSNLKRVFREIPPLSVKHKKYKQILYDKYVDALINNTDNSIKPTDYIFYFSRINNKKGKQRLYDFIKKIPISDLSNKDCNKIIKRSKDAELNELLWNKIINNNPTWGDINYLYLFTEHYKEKASELLAQLYPERFLKEYNYQEYENILIEKKMGKQAFKEFSELRVISKKDFFEIKNDYDHFSYETKIHPRYVIIKFSNKEECENPTWEDFHLFGGNYRLSLKLVVKMHREDFY
jgi:hypothetical protein